MWSIIWNIILCIICEGIMNVMLAYIIQNLWEVFDVNRVKGLLFMVVATCTCGNVISA